MVTGRGRLPPVRVATVGNFDGVHRGHQALIARARDHAGDGQVVAVTFDPHPQAVIRPDTAPTSLATLERRVELLRECGADEVVVVPFTLDLAQRSPREFAQLLREDPAIAADMVVVGENFRFGQRASGDVAMLDALGQELGFGVDAVALLDGDGREGMPWSSSLVRERLAVADLAGAAEALGRWHRLEGIVVHGDHRGRELGYPTANVDVRGAVLIPPDGVYAGWLVDTAGTETLPAAISIGTNPQFGGHDRRVEAYVLDRSDLDLYGHDVALDLVARLRGQLVFDSVDELIEQMGRDVAEARAVLGD